MKNYGQMFGNLALAHSVMFASSTPIYFHLTLSVDDGSFSDFIALRALLSKKRLS